jgi:hypothetical protein
MEKTLVTELRNEAINLDLQMDVLRRKRESIANLLDYYSDLEETIQETVTVKKKDKATTKKQPKAKASKNRSKSGLMKFSQALKNVFVSKPDIPYTSKDLVKIMNKEIEAGRCNPSKKDMTSAVSAYIWNFSQRGLLKKSGDGYLWIGKERNNDKTDKVEWVNDLDLLDEAIIEILKRSEEMSEDGIIHDVRICSSYGDIARNLNGSLASEVQKHLQRLTAVNLVINHNGNLSFNHKADL